MSSPPAKVRLVHAPTPLERFPALDALVGCELWVKRDDATGGAEAGNKIRKLEYLLADATARGANVVITCGGLQSNHARATAIAARKLGMAPVLVLRTPDGKPPVGQARGNLLLDRMVGAELHFVSPAEYAARDSWLAELAARVERSGRHAYVIPEGGSNGLGSLGYVDAMEEVRRQLDTFSAGPRSFDAVVHACGSGGTAAGVAIGAQRFSVASEALVVAVCDDRSYFEQRIAGIQRETSALLADARAVPMRILDAFKGPAYGVPSAEQVAFIVEVARVSGLILDPVYSGKALFGLARFRDKPKRALFIHTGGLPGLLAEPEFFSDASLSPTFPTLQSS